MLPQRYLSTVSIYLSRLRIPTFGSSKTGVKIESAKTPIQLIINNILEEMIFKASRARLL